VGCGSAFPSLPFNMAFQQGKFFHGGCRIGDRAIAVLNEAEVLAERAL